MKSPGRHPWVGGWWGGCRKTSSQGKDTSTYGWLEAKHIHKTHANKYALVGQRQAAYWGYAQNVQKVHSDCVGLKNYTEMIQQTIRHGCLGANKRARRNANNIEETKENMLWLDGPKHHTKHMPRIYYDWLEPSTYARNVKNTACLRSFTVAQTENSKRTLFRTSP